MRVAECEIVFTIGRDLAPRLQPWTRAEVLAAVTAVHPGIEVPDSRFLAFEQAGEAQLIADCACMNDMVLGAPVVPDTRVDALPELFPEGYPAGLPPGRSACALCGHALPVRGRPAPLPPL